MACESKKDIQGNGDEVAVTNGNHNGDELEILNAISGDIDLLKLENILSEDPSGIYNNVTKPLSKILLDQDFLDSLENTSTQKSMDLLSVFNRSILILNKNASTDAKGVLDLYKLFLLKGCDENYNGCKNLLFFSKDHLTSEVVLSFEKNNKLEIGDSLDLLELALKLKNKSSNEKIIFKYFDLLSVYQLKSKEQVSPKTLRRFHKLNILMSKTDDGQKNYLFEKITENNNVFELIESKSLLFGQEFLSILASRISLNKFKKQLKEFITKDSSVSVGISPSDLSLKNYNETYSSINEYDKNAFNNFSIKKMPTSGLVDAKDMYYFYIIDQLFHEKMTPATASLFWSNIEDKNITNFKSVFRTYIFTYMLRATLRTHEKMSNFFISNKSKISSNAIRVMQDMLNTGAILVPHWHAIQDKINAKLTTFIDLNITSKKFKKPLDQSANLELSRIIQYIPDNIKYMAVYPLQIIMSYEMAKVGWEINLRTFWGSFTIGASDIIEWLIDGKFRPWFEFVKKPKTKTNSAAKALNAHEVTYAFDFLFAADGLNKYKIKGDDFFKILSEHYLKKTFQSPSINSFNDRKRSYKDLSNNPSVHYFHNICDAYNSGKSVTIDQNPYSITKTLVFGSQDQNRHPLTSKALTTSAWLFSNMKWSFETSWDLTRSVSVTVPSDEMEYIRSNINVRLNNIQLALNSYERFLISNSRNESEVKIISKYLYHEFSSKGDDFTNMIYKSLDNYYDCTVMFQKLEFKRREHVLVGMNLFIQSIYKSIEDLRFLKTEGDKHLLRTQTVLENYPNLNIWSDLNFNDLDLNLSFLDAVNERIVRNSASLKLVPELVAQNLRERQISERSGEFVFQFPYSTMMYKAISLMENGFYQNGQLRVLNDRIKYDFSQFPKTIEEVHTFEAKSGQTGHFTRNTTLSIVSNNQSNFIEKQMSYVLKYLDFYPSFGRNFDPHKQMVKLYQIKLKMMIDEIFNSKDTTGCNSLNNKKQFQSCVNKLIDPVIDDIMSKNIDFYEFMYLNEDREMLAKNLGWLSLDHNAIIPSFHISYDFFVLDKNLRPKGYFDYFYDYISTDFTGSWSPNEIRGRVTDLMSAFDPKAKPSQKLHAGRLSLAKIFYQSTNNGKRILGTNADGLTKTDISILDTHQNSVNAYYYLLRRLEEKINEFDNNPSSVRPIYNYVRNEAPVVLRAVNKQSIKDVKEEELEFHCDTEGFFIGSTNIELRTRVINNSCRRLKSIN